MHYVTVSLCFLFQMVQAIQVLRFHLLELEKVSIFYLTISKKLLDDDSNEFS